MAIMIPDLSGISEGLGVASSAIAEGLQKRAEKRLGSSQKSAKNKILQDADWSSQEGQKKFLSDWTAAGGDLKEGLAAMKQFKSDPLMDYFRNNLPGIGEQREIGDGQPTVLDKAMQPDQKRSVEPEQAEQQQMSGLDGVLESIPQEVVLAAASHEDPAIRSAGKMINDLKEQKYKKDVDADKRWTQERDFHTKMSDKSVARINNMAHAVPRKEMAFALAEDAIRSGEVGAFSGANIARVTGMNEFQTAKGKQLVTASKEHLISNLSKVSAKAQNIWLEKMISSMFPQIGSSEQANLAANIMLRAENELDDAEIKAHRELQQQDREETKRGERSGYAKRDIDERLDEKMEPIRDKILRRASFKLRVNWEEEKGTDWLRQQYNKKVVRGTPMTPGMLRATAAEYAKRNKKEPGELTAEDAAIVVRNAKKLGYVFPTKSEKAEWE